MSKNKRNFASIEPEIRKTRNQEMIMQGGQDKNSRKKNILIQNRKNSKNPSLWIKFFLCE